MAICRRVELSQEEFGIFASELARFEPIDVKAALRALSVRQRQPYETALPDLGTMLSECRKARETRINASLPAPPVLNDKGPSFTRCEGPHQYILGKWMAYLNENGEPYEPSRGQDPTPVLTFCRCERDFHEQREAWQRDVWAPHMREYHEWEAQCEEIRQAHLALSRAA